MSLPSYHDMEKAPLAHGEAGLAEQDAQRPHPEDLGLHLKKASFATRTKQKWAGLSLIRKLLVVLGVAWLFTHAAHGVAKLSGFRDGRHAWRGCHGSSWKDDVPVITAAVYGESMTIPNYDLDTYASETVQTGNATFDSELDHRRVLNFEFAAEGELVISRASNDEDAQLVVESVWDGESAPTGVRLASGGWYDSVIVGAVQGISHKMHLVVPATATEIPHLRVVSPLSLKVTLHPSLGEIKFGSFDLLTNGELDIPEELAVQSIDIHTTYGDIKGSYNVTDVARFHSTTGDIKVELFVHPEPHHGHGNHTHGDHPDGPHHHKKHKKHGKHDKHGKHGKGKKDHKGKGKRIFEDFDAEDWELVSVREGEEERPFPPPPPGRPGRGPEHRRPGPGHGPHGPHGGPHHGPHGPPHPHEDDHAVRIFADTSTGDIYLKIHQPANVSVGTHTHSSTGDIVIDEGENFKGLFRAGTHTGSIVTKTQDPKEIRLIKKHSGGPGQFVEGLVKFINETVPEPGHGGHDGPGHEGPGEGEKPGHGHDDDGDDDDDDDDDDNDDDEEEDNLLMMLGRRGEDDHDGPRHPPPPPPPHGPHGPHPPPPHGPPHGPHGPGGPGGPGGPHHPPPPHHRLPPGVSAVEAFTNTGDIRLHL